MDEGAEPDYKLYSPLQIAFGTLEGSPLAGAVLMAINYRRLGQTRAARRILAAGVLGLAAVFAVVLSFPPTYVMGLVIIYTVGLHEAAKRLQGAAYAEHLLRGGQRASLKATATVATACAAAALGVALACDTLMSAEWGERISVGAGRDIYYGKGVTEGHAYEVARVLGRAGWFDGPGGTTVRLARTPEGFAVSLIVRAGAWNEPDIVDWFRQVAEDLSAEAFGGRPVEVRLCDSSRRTRKVIASVPDRPPAEAFPKAP